MFRSSSSHCNTTSIRLFVQGSFAWHYSDFNQYCDNYYKQIQLFGIIDIECQWVILLVKLDKFGRWFSQKPEQYWGDFLGGNPPFRRCDQSKLELKDKVCRVVPCPSDLWHLPLDSVLLVFSIRSAHRGIRWPTGRQEMSNTITSVHQSWEKILNVLLK